MAPLGAPQPPTVPTTSPLSNKDPKEQKQDSLFGNPVFPPMIDMSSTQALLHMVRTANAAQNAAELETYLKGKSHAKTRHASSETGEKRPILEDERERERGGIALTRYSETLVFTITLLGAQINFLLSL